MNVSDQHTNDILANAILGFEVEFFHNVGIEKAKKDLQKILNKKILVFDKSHSDFVPTTDTFKMEPDYSAGQKTIELVTGPLPYAESKLILTKIFKYIQENGSTNDRCGLHYNVSFSKTLVESNIISHMDTLKFILDFDEEMVYEKFPKRRDNVYAKSIKYIIPRSKYFLENGYDFNAVTPKNFILPSTKYYGINFTKLIKSYLEFRYIGGKDYEKRSDDIWSVINHSILTLYTSISNRLYTDENKVELERIFKKHEKVILAYKSYSDFVKAYPKIKLTVNLEQDPKIIEVFFGKLRDKLFEILTEASLKQGYLNYDSDRGRMQIEDSSLMSCHMIENVDIVSCKIQGNIQNCDLSNCYIVNSSIDTCNIIHSTTVDSSKLRNCYVSKSNTVKNCYIFGNNGILAGTMEGGIFREGNITSDTNFNNSEVISFKKI